MRVRRAWLAGWLVAVHALLAAALLKSDFVDRVAARLGVPGAGDERLRRFRLDMLALHRRVDAALPAGRVLFFGDSIVQGLAVAAVHPQGENFGIGGETTGGLLERLPAYSSIGAARAIVVLSGTNDLMRHDPSTPIANLQRLIETLPGKAPVVLATLLPVDERADVRLAGRNAAIARVNAAIRALCAARARVTCADVGATMAAPGGGLAAALHEGDGVHPSPAGYAAFIRVLRDALAAAAVAP